MKLFTTIAFEIGAQCNRVCWFCPNAINKRPNEFMSNTLINKITKELSSINYSGRIVLYIYNEPLKDKRLLAIIKQIRRRIPKSTIMIATNADYIKYKEQIKDLYDAGLNQLQINIYSNQKRFNQLTDMMKSIDSQEGNIYTNTSPKKKIYSIEKKFDKEITIESPKVGRFELSNRSGNVPSLPTLTEPLNKTCVRPFRSIQINWSGNVILCCNDYHGEEVVGNIKLQSILDVWYNSSKLNSIRNKLLNKDRTEINLCSKCSFNGGAYTYLIYKQWGNEYALFT